MRSSDTQNNRCWWISGTARHSIDSFHCLRRNTEKLRDVLLRPFVRWFTPDTFVCYKIIHTLAICWLAARSNCQHSTLGVFHLPSALWSRSAIALLIKLFIVTPPSVYRGTVWHIENALAWAQALLIWSESGFIRNSRLCTSQCPIAWCSVRCNKLAEIKAANYCVEIMLALVGHGRAIFAKDRPADMGKAIANTSQSHCPLNDFPNDSKEFIFQLHEVNMESPSDSNI